MMRILSAGKQGPQACVMVVVRRGWRSLFGPGSTLSHSVCTQQSILYAWLRFARFGSMVSRPFYDLVFEEQTSPAGPEPNIPPAGESDWARIQSRFVNSILLCPFVM